MGPPLLFGGLDRKVVYALSLYHLPDVEVFLGWIVGL